MNAHRSIRISPTLWTGREDFGRLLGELDARPGLVEELSLFSSWTHAPVPIETVTERMEIARERMAAAREHGYRAGINILATIGHHEENLPRSIGPEFGCGTDLSGTVCRGSFCPASEPLIERIRVQYALVSGAEPDFIWVDDDVRLFGHMPIRATCFCDRCLELFAAETGERYTRESLARAFDSGDTASKLAVRRAWLEHNREIIRRLFTVIEETVHGIAPDLAIGFMTGERFFEGYAFDRWGRELSGKRNVPIRWRPGGGFYTDRTPDLLLEKVHQIGRQTAALPDGIVESVQSELENFPYQRLSKSERITLTESAADIAAGCTGVAFNILPAYPADLPEVFPLFDSLHAGVPFLDAVANAFTGARRQGLWAAWNADAMASAGLDRGAWLDGSSAGFTAAFPLELYQIGIPPAYRPGDAAVTALRGDTAAVLGGDEIRSILSGGVYMDAEALTRLCEAGYSELLGFEPGRAFAVDCIEEFTAHPLNTGLEGRRRDTRQSFWHEAAVEIVPAAGASVLARLIDYGDDEICSSAMGVFENRLGGRVCVSGYSPWSLLHSGAKASQLKAVIRWLSRDTLGAYVDSYHRVSLWYGVRPDGSRAVAAINCSADPARAVRLALSGAVGKVTAADDSLSTAELRPKGSDGAYTVFELPRVEPWKMVLLGFS